MKTRHQVRECVLQALYALTMGGGDKSHVLETLVRPKFAEGGSTARFAERLFTETLDAEREASELIDRHVDNWALKRIACVDRLILRMAVCELLRFEDIPPKVTINEAIELGKEYSTPKSGQFINGILDAALGELLRTKVLKKRGRGLVGMDPAAV